MMNDILCGYTGDREAMLMAYLYGELGPADHASFEAHLTTCARCRSEINGLDDVRAHLARWSPPEPNLATVARRTSLVSVPPDKSPSFLARLDMPAWAQVAAAMVVLGVSAGVANLDVRYDGNGLSIRTGWSKTPRTIAETSLKSTNAANAANPASLANPRNPTPSPWRADLIALEQQLRSEIRAPQAGTPSAVVAHAPSSGDADVMRRVKALVDESERRQQNELALRVAEVVRDLNLQRQADLRKIDQNLGMFQDKTGVEVLRNRQKLDYILQRVSQQPQ
jgi:hypothetical protein